MRISMETKELELVEFISAAIDHVEKNSTDETRGAERWKLALWLRNKYTVALKDVVVSREDGRAYMQAIYLDGDKEKELKVPVDAWQDRFVTEMKAAKEAAEKNNA
jgi:hypothetical protein